jgi:hypothetical protein
MIGPRAKAAQGIGLCWSFLRPGKVPDVAGLAFDKRKARRGLGDLCEGARCTKCHQPVLGAFWFLPSWGFE